MPGPASQAASPRITRHRSLSGNNEEGHRTESRHGARRRAWCGAAPPAPTAAPGGVRLGAVTAGGGTGKGGGEGGGAAAATIHNH